MNDKISNTQRKLEAAGARIAQRRDHLEQLLVQQRDAESAHQGRVEDFIVETARATGATSLPLQVIVEAIRSLGGTGKEAGAEKAQSVKTAETKKVDAPHRRRGGSKSKASNNDDHVEVSVKFTNRVKGDERAVLKKAKLHWNGKRGRWIGVVDAATAVTLRKMFPDRFAVESPSRAGAAAGLASVETTPQDAAAAGDATTSGMPMPAETVPAGGIGRDAPHTPPVGQVDTAAARAGGAVTGGAEAVTDGTKDHAGDMPVAPAPVQEPSPVAAKSPAPAARPGPRFPNLPRAGARG
jgi:hypothetical protein